MSFLFDMMNTAKSGLAPAVAAPPHNFAEVSSDLNTAASSGYAGASSGYGGGGYGKCVYCCEDDDDDFNEALAALAGLAGALGFLSLFLNLSAIGKRSFPETFLFDYYDYTIPGNYTTCTRYAILSQG